MSESEGAVCANIGPKERRMRVMSGVIGLVLTIGVTAALLITQAPRWSRAFVFLPAALSAFGFFQARAQTCVAFAAQGIKVLGDDRKSKEAVSGDEQRQIAKQARGVYRDALLASAAVVVLLLLAP